MGLVTDVKKEDVFERKTTVSNPWLDPAFKKVESLGGEPGFKVDDIAERLGLVQHGEDISLSTYYFSDLEGVPSDYGVKGQFLQTDGKSKLSWAWPFWSKAGSTVYYKSGKVAIGHAAPQEIFHISAGQETLASRISCKVSPWRQWECLDSGYGFAWGIAADDKKFHLHYDTPMGTVSVHGLCFDALNSRIGILDDTPSYPCDIGGNTRVQGTLGSGELTVDSGADCSIIIKGTSTGNANLGWIGFYDSDGTTRRGHIGDGSVGNDDIYIGADTGYLRLLAAGYISLGTHTYFPDDVVMSFGASLDYSIGYYSTDDEFQIVDGSTLDSNVRLKLDSSGHFDFGAGNLTTTGTLGCGVLTAATGSTVGNLTLADGSITDSGGAISFGNENLSTTGILTLANEGLHLLDTNASHDLIVKPGSDLTADRILTLTTGNAARTITLSGNPTLDDWFDQPVKQASDPTFNTVNLQILHSSTDIQCQIDMDQGANQIGIKPGYEVGDNYVIFKSVDDTITSPQIYPNADGEGQLGLVTKRWYSLHLLGFAALYSNAELRFYDNGNYVGFEAPALGANQIWVLPNADGPANEVLGTDNAGNLIWRSFSEIAGYAPSADEKVKVDSGATADYLGAASNDGVLRVAVPLSYTDGGNFVTIGVDGTVLVDADFASAGICMSDGAGTYSILPAGVDAVTDHNLYMGAGAGASLAAGGQHHILIGESAGASLTTADKVVCIGYQSGEYGDLEYENVYIGYRAGRGASAGQGGSINVAIGVSALQDVNAGNYNVAIGTFALQNLTSGSNNFGLGYNALGNITTHARNVGIGSSTGLFYGHTSSVLIGYFAGARSNDAKLVAIGDEAGRGSNAGGCNFSECVYIGYYAGRGLNCTGVAIYNVAVGTYALQDITLGDYNTVIGHKAGEDITTGLSNVCLGSFAGSGQVTTGSNQLWIANSNTATPLIYGEFDNALLKIYDFLFLPNIKSGATQAGAGAAAGELWKTASHATLLDNIVMIGV